MIFNKIVKKFSDDMVKKEYQRYCNELKFTMGYLIKKRIHFRLDRWTWRSWEYCHLLQKINSESKIIMDFGGGNSLLSYHLALMGRKVFMVDVDKQSIDNFNKNIKKLKLTKVAKGIEFNGRILPFANAYFDLVIFISVIEHIPFHQRKRTFDELRRVLKPNKNLLMTFDYGKGAKVFGDPLTSIKQIYQDIVKLSGLRLEGNHFSPVKFDKKYGLPIKSVIKDENGMDEKVTQFSVGACCLVNDRLSRDIAD
jgi:ubiquinone/menaquinone biosynthesis C-methylase UbiE